MIATYQYWPIDKPIPEGWRDCGKLGGNHGHYSRLIERECGTPPSIVAIEHGDGAALTGSLGGKPFTIPVSLSYAAQLAGELVLIIRTQLHRKGDGT